MSNLNLVSALLNIAATGLNAYTEIKRRERERRIEVRRRKIMAMIIACPASDIHTLIRLQAMLANIDTPITTIRIRRFAGVKIVTQITK